MKKVRVYSYVVENSGALFPLHIYSSISETARELELKRSTVGYYLRQQGSYKFERIGKVTVGEVVTEYRDIYILSLNSLTMLKKLDPIPLEALHSDTNEELHNKSIEDCVNVKKSWTTRLLNWLF